MCTDYKEASTTILLHATSMMKVLFPKLIRPRVYFHKEKESRGMIVSDHCQQSLELPRRGVSAHALGVVLITLIDMVCGKTYLNCG